jgi:[ribosomal protein S18]-alanine N-acetyltransferase
MSAHQTPERDWQPTPESRALLWRTGGLLESAAVAQLAERSFEPHFREAWTEAQIAALLATSGAWLNLGMDGPDAVAFAMSRQLFEEVELLLCAVAPERRRCGEGRQLIEQVAESARGRGARRLFLEVRSSNEAALSLYRLAGFQAEGRRADYYRTLGGESIDAITLSLVL